MTTTRILRLGLTGPDAHPAFAGISEDQFAERVAGVAGPGVVRDGDALRVTFESPPVFGEMAPGIPVNQADPREAGWTFVVGEDDPQAGALIAALEPLARHRHMTDPGKPLVFPTGADITDYLHHSYLGGTDDNSRPKYVLLAGGPAHLPFQLQVQWGAVGAAVGRVAFADVSDLDAYVEKVVRLERAPDAIPAASAVVFAPNYGGRDATVYSYEFMAKPIAEKIRANPRFTANLLGGDDATKANLLEVLTTTRPGLVYTAGHGYELPRSSGLAEQKRLNGAICCARQPSLDDMLVRAEDIPDDRPCAEGAIVFQFACWGYGTPRQATFQHWQLDGDGGPLNADEDFVASLPTRLLSHPRGPVAFVGHLDTAWLHGFDDPAHPVPTIGTRYHPRLEPFLTAVDRALCKLNPAGYALGDLSSVMALLSVNLADFFDQLQRQGRDFTSLSAAEREGLADGFIRRNDAMFFLVLGDPGARVRVDVP